MAGARLRRALAALAALLAAPGLLALEYPPTADNYTVCQGDNATLSCAIDAEVTRVAWLNGSHILYAGGDKWSLDPRVRLLAHSDAEFAVAIAAVGPHDEGLYTCSFQTPARPHTAHVFLIVHVPARITNISAAVTVDEGSDVTLLCLAAGRPPPAVTWRQPWAGPPREGEVLEVAAIRRGQAGRYQCQAANGVAQPDTRWVPVTVNYPPSITEAQGARPAPGQRGLLRCGALAEPPPAFEWFKDERPLLGGREGLQIRTERTRSLLLVANVTRRHYGNYTCRASNGLGSAAAALRLLHPGSLDSAAPPGPAPTFGLAAAIVIVTLTTTP